MKAPEYSIDLDQFTKNPYPDLTAMRALAPVCSVPQLQALLLTRRDDIFVCEKNVDVFSSVQPQGLMTQLMGQNMMRKDGEAHLIERRQLLPTTSPGTVKEVWKRQFELDTDALIAELSSRVDCDLVTDFAMPVSANALRHVTGLINLSAAEIDQVSQAMIDGISNFSGDASIEAKCREATAKVDECIDEVLSLPNAQEFNPHTMIQVLFRADQPIEAIRANIKLAISGGQNEPRDAIAGTAWALLQFPDQLALIHADNSSWREAFEEYARWISPIGMSPRETAMPFVWEGIEIEEGVRVFLMYGSANRDERVFDEPTKFDITRKNAKSVSFGAGPHFCAGAAVSRTLISDVALPRLFAAFPKMRVIDEVLFDGWAFRGPQSVNVRLQM